MFRGSPNKSTAKLSFGINFIPICVTYLNEEGDEVFFVNLDSNSRLVGSRHIFSALKHQRWFNFAEILYIYSFLINQVCSFSDFVTSFF